MKKLEIVSKLSENSFSLVYHIPREIRKKLLLTACPSFTHAALFSHFFVLWEHIKFLQHRLFLSH